MSEAITNAIMKIPETIQDEIYWVCYNYDMIEKNRAMIVELRGEEFASRVTVIAANSVNSLHQESLNPRKVYYSPDFFAHRGNGAN